MKETTLKRVARGQGFVFGGVKFFKVTESDDQEMVMCRIAGAQAFVYISECAIVKPGNLFALLVIRAQALIGNRP
jgi:hypothetical protein